MIYHSKILAITLQNQLETNFVDLRLDEGKWELMVEPRLDGELAAPKGGRRRCCKSLSILSIWQLMLSNREIATIVRFTPRGDLVFVGTSLGSIYIYETTTKEVCVFLLWVVTWLIWGVVQCVHHEKVCVNASITGMEFDPKGTALVINSNDRFIRVFGIDAEAGNLLLHHKFVDHITQTPWSGCMFSKDGEFVCAGAGAQTRSTSRIYLINSSNLHWY